MNAPPAEEHLILADDETKAQYDKDTLLTHSGTFTFWKEDHTLGNPIRMSLLRDNRVLFAGYRMPHPLEHRVCVKVRTRETTNPVVVVKDSIDLLCAELTTVETDLKAQIQHILERNNYERNHWN
mmetsp:Transcript_2307/g.3119  ORF Transcript_2307/g.3119 Transcript_2307/m.3119 type:complete len:125 (+) Transcript_2307:32-406(+)